MQKITTKMGKKYITQNFLPSFSDTPSKGGKKKRTSEMKPCPFLPWRHQPNLDYVQIHVGHHWRKGRNMAMIKSQLECKIWRTAEENDYIRTRSCPMNAV